MKTMIKMLFTCSILLAVTSQSHAQKDSTLQITLTAQEHAYIIAFMPSKSGVDDVRYLNQVASQLQVDAAGHVSDSLQAITVTVNFDQVKRMYVAIGSQQERLAGFYNTEIKQRLVPQLYARPALLNQIVAQTQKSGSETEQLIQLGFDYIKAIKQ